jgi:hypothetical protein
MVDDNTFFTIASSGSGQLMVAADFGGGVYLYQPACPSGYQHVGFDAAADPNGTNLCFTCGEGYYGQLTADAEEVECLPCGVGTYTTASPVYGSSSCSRCAALYSTLDDASHGESSCFVFEIDLAHLFQWVMYAAGFVWFVMVLYYATRPGRLQQQEDGQSPLLAVFLVLVVPFFDLCTDVAYLAISPFYSVYIFVLCVVCFFHPVILFVLQLCQLRALPTSLRFIWWLGSAQSAGSGNEGGGECEGASARSSEGERQAAKGEAGAEASRGDFIPYPTITYPRGAGDVVTSRFALVLAFDVHDTLLTVSFEVAVWCVAVALQALTLVALPACLLVWLVVGMILQLTQTITLSPLWNMWFLLWTGDDRFCDTGPGGVDTEALNFGILHHFLLEAVPGLALQVANNTLMQSWTEDPVAIMSVCMSAVMCLSVLYKYLYHSALHAEAVGVKNVPVDR